MAKDQLIADNKNSHLSPTVRARLQQCYEFGNQKMQAGEYDYANEMFQQCFLKSPGNMIYLQSFIANLRLKYNNNKKGASFAKLKSGKPKAALKMAESRSKWDDVLSAGAELLMLNPWDGAVYASMGRAAIASGYDDTGLALMKHAVECNPADIESNRFAAEQLEERELYEDAIACLQRILNVKADDRDAKRRMGDLMLKRTMRDMETKKGFKKEANLEANEKLSEEDQFEKRIQKTPEDRDLWIQYAEFFFQKRNFRKTEDTYRRAQKQFPDDTDFALRLCEVQRMRAREDFLRTRELYAKNPDDLLKEKMAKQRADYDEKSLAFIKQKLAVNPTATATRYEYGIYLMQHGQFREAVIELQAAQLDDTIKSDCFLAIAQCFECMKQYKLAKSHYEKAIAGYGNKTTETLKKALYQAARLSAGLGDFKAAEQYASRLAEIDFSYKDVGVLLDKIEKKMQNG